MYDYFQVKINGTPEKTLLRPFLYVQAENYGKNSNILVRLVFESARLLWACQRHYRATSSSRTGLSCQYQLWRVMHQRFHVTLVIWGILNLTFQCTQCGPNVVPPSNPMLKRWKWKVDYPEADEDPPPARGWSWGGGGADQGGSGAASETKTKAETLKKTRTRTKG